MLNHRPVQDNENCGYETYLSHHIPHTGYSKILNRTHHFYFLSCMEDMSFQAQILCMHVIQLHLCCFAWASYECMFCIKLLIGFCIRQPTYNINPRSFRIKKSTHLRCECKSTCFTANLMGNIFYTLVKISLTAQSSSENIHVVKYLLCRQFL